VRGTLAAVALAGATLAAALLIESTQPPRPVHEGGPLTLEGRAGKTLTEELEEQAESEEGREEALERARESGTLGLTAPLRANPAPGWAGERLWRPGADDWEPAVAGHPGSQRIYMLTTRYGGMRACSRCPSPAIRLRASKDGGRHWSGDRFLCECRGSRHQYDPEIEMAADGSLYAAWLDGFAPGVTFARSDDRGRTWTKPVHVDRQLAWSDKPIVAISDDGEDVYIAFNGPSQGDAWVAASHDRGDHFADPVRAGSGRRYHFAGGGAVAPDGTVAFGQTSYNQRSSGKVRVLATTSADGGATWNNAMTDVMAKQPDCVSRGCPEDFYGPQAAMASDAAGRLLILYNGASRRNGRQRTFARTSTDGGITWSTRDRLSPRTANAAFPAAVGAAAGDFRAWFMDDRSGHRRWNVWFRQTLDGGGTWTPAARLSDAGSGTAYKRHRGFLEPYGDYGEIAVVAGGGTFAAWGEGRSYFGPGGTWFNRTR
jgi:BNR repeat-like domain